MDQDALSEQLIALEPGQRAWFLFCDGLEGADALQLAPFTSDFHTHGLMERLKGTSAPRRSRLVVGMCQLGEDGVISFAAPDIGRQELRQLATWARSQVAERPTLGRLYGACALTVNERFEVEGRFEDPELWGGLVPMETAATLERELPKLYAMVPGEAAWFWCTDAGPGGSPCLLLEPIREGQTIRSLNRRVEDAIRRSDSLGGSMRGLLTCESNGSFTVETQTQDLAQRRLARALGKADSRLRWMSRPPPQPPQDVAGAAEVLLQLSEDDSAAFCMVAHASGARAFHVAAELEALAPQITAAEAAGLEHSSGLLVQGADHIELFADRPFEALLPALARWVAAHYLDHISLVRLYGAKVAFPSDDAAEGMDEAWAFLR